MFQMKRNTRIHPSDATTSKFMGTDGCELIRARKEKKVLTKAKPK